MLGMHRQRPHRAGLVGVSATRSSIPTHTQRVFYPNPSPNPKGRDAQQEEKGARPVVVGAHGLVGGHHTLLGFLSSP